MSRQASVCTLTVRDQELIVSLFENRVMSFEQIQRDFFPAISVPTVSRRLAKMRRSGFVVRSHVSGMKNGAQSVFLNTPKALKVIAQTYRYAITSELYKSDSIYHDIVLVELRRRLQGFSSVTNYFTENMLQSCGKFAEMDEMRPFVLNNTDAVVEVTRQERKLLVGLEFENSEKAKERYVRKLVNYYSEGGIPLILYICTTPRVREAVAQAESEVVGQKVPRCFYGLLSDVLGNSPGCTFADLKGAEITVN